MLILVLSDVQYSQNAVFSFEKFLNHQNCSSSGSQHLVKKSPKQCSLFFDTKSRKLLKFQVKKDSNFILKPRQGTFENTLLTKLLSEFIELHNVLFSFFLSNILENQGLTSTAQSLRSWFPNPGVSWSNPLGGSKVDSAFHPSGVDRMSTTNFWELRFFFKKAFLEFHSAF